jgi:hypothetical protein
MNFCTPHPQAQGKGEGGQKLQGLISGLMGSIHLHGHQHTHKKTPVNQRCFQVKSMRIFAVCGMAILRTKHGVPQQTGYKLRHKTVIQHASDQISKHTQHNFKIQCVSDGTCPRLYSHSREYYFNDFKMQNEHTHTQTHTPLTQQLIQTRASVTI